jgi:hypothetical protein
MATGRAFSKIAVAFVVFLLIWVVGIGLLYAQFQTSPVKQMSVRDGAVIGEMGFIEARAAACTGFTMILFILLVIFLIRASKPAQRGVSGPQLVGEPSSSFTAEGWYPDPTTRHELRYWNGTAWTEHVSDAGVAAVEAPSV